MIAKHIKTGDLKGLAEKTVTRPLRLLIPIACIAMLEYFLMDTGVVYWLEYIPSVTWSTWPFVTVPANFGDFMSEILQLAYLIPNAAPQITSNYCTGVLWTIPVQLQGSWLTMLSAIMIFEIKTPWKRFSFYAYCVVIHWCALSWATFFYVGILLTDLDLTYKYRTWLHKNVVAYWALIVLLSLMTVGGISFDFMDQWMTTNVVQYEYGIHPDLASGRPISQTDNWEFPQYFVPKFNALVYITGAQTIIEISTFWQKVFSINFLTLLRPHIFTIYLIHGFIFWSLGSTVCIYLATQDYNYSVNVLIVAVCCYLVLFLSLPILTPIVELISRDVCRNLWKGASEPPPKRRRTLYPFDGRILERKDEIMSHDKLATENDRNTVEMEQCAMAAPHVPSTPGVERALDLQAECL